MMRALIKINMYVVKHIGNWFRPKQKKHTSASLIYNWVFENSMCEAVTLLIGNLQTAEYIL